MSRAPVSNPVEDAAGLTIGEIRFNPADPRLKWQLVSIKHEPKLPQQAAAIVRELNGSHDTPMPLEKWLTWPFWEEASYETLVLIVGGDKASIATWLHSFASELSTTDSNAIGSDPGVEYDYQVFGEKPFDDSFPSLTGFVDWTNRRTLEASPGDGRKLEGEES